MFTGLVQAVGTVTRLAPRGDDMAMCVASPAGMREGLNIGDSVAVNGVCLTATSFEGDGFWVDASRETLSLTTLGRITAGSPVNLETALTLSRPLGGHLMSGHVDGVGRLLSQQDDGRSRRLRFEVPKALSRYVARKGSVAVDGVSLTVNEVEGECFGVNIIPHTWEATTLGRLRDGDPVNIEVDLIARYLERLLSGREDDAADGSDERLMTLLRQRGLVDG